MPFGQLVIGSPGAGKSTYVAGMGQLLHALHRPASIVNLDPANENLPYAADVDVRELISVEDVMKEERLGPNGAMLFCMEYLADNVEWLEERLASLGPDAYVLFDLPGQVEVSTNHPSLRKVLDRLAKSDLRLVALHLVDASHITDASRYLSLVLLSLRAMLMLELPHINVLSKIDLLADQADELDFNLDFYSEVQDLSYLTTALDRSYAGVRGLGSSSSSRSVSPTEGDGKATEAAISNSVAERLGRDRAEALIRGARKHAARYHALNTATAELIEDFSLVNFETLAVEDKESMFHLLQIADKAGGYIYQLHSNHSHDAGPDMGEAWEPGSRIATAGGLLGQDPNAELAKTAKGASAAALFTTADTGSTRPLAADMPSSATAMGPLDVQERWIDNRKAWDEWRVAQQQEQMDTLNEQRIYQAADRVLAKQKNAPTGEKNT